MSDSKPTKPKLPQTLKSSELSRMLEGTDALRKAALSMDNLLGTAGLRAIKDAATGGSLMRQMDEAFRHHKQFEEGPAAKMLKAMSLPESTLAKQLSEAMRFQQQFEVSPIGKMMKDLSANDGAIAGLGGLKRELWESAALKGLPDWTGAAAAKFAMPDRELTRYASFMGEAFKAQHTLKAMGLIESSITTKVVGLHAGKGLFDELTKSLAHTIDPFAGKLKAAGLWEQGDCMNRRVTA